MSKNLVWCFCLLLLVHAVQGQVAKGDKVYTTLPIAQFVDGKISLKLPGTACQIAEIWPTHIIALFEDGQEIRIDKANLATAPLTSEAVQGAIESRITSLPGDMAVQETAIKALKEKISRKTNSGTLQRKVSERRSTGGGVSIKYAPSKEEMELAAMEETLKELKAELEALRKLTVK